MLRYLIIISLFFIYSCEKETYNHTVYIPTAFTPNGDGKNEIFIIKTDASQVLSYEMNVFDTDGYSLYTSDNIRYGWDGKSDKDIYCPEGNYMFNIYIKFVDNEEENFTGSVRIVK